MNGIIIVDKPAGFTSHDVVAKLRGIYKTRRIGPVSYTHLDVYKRQEEFIAAALSPSEVVSVTADTDSRTCSVIVPDSQLSLAIGREGQNAVSYTHLASS